MLVQNFKAIGRESGSGDPLIFENLTKMLYNLSSMAVTGHQKSFVLI